MRTPLALVAALLALPPAAGANARPETRPQKPPELISSLPLALNDRVMQAPAPEQPRSENQGTVMQAPAPEKPLKPEHPGTVMQAPAPEKPAKPRPRDGAGEAPEIRFEFDKLPREIYKAFRFSR